MGLLVNAVGNFDGSGFVPSKNQRHGARAAMELPRAVNGGSFSNRQRSASATANLDRCWARCAAFARCLPVVVPTDVEQRDAFYG